MSDDKTDAQAALDQALEQMKAKGMDLEVQAIEHYMVGEPTQHAADTLWMVLVGGLLLILLISLGGLIYVVVADKTSDVLLAVFTGVLTGLLGLFVKSPVTAQE